MEKPEYELMYRIERDHWWYKAKQNLIRRWLNQALPPDQGTTGLDVGCGTGMLMELLSHDYVMHGCDPSPEALAFCRERRLSRLVQGSAKQLPYGDGSFDFVTCSDVLEHIQDDTGAVREIQRVLRSGGYLLATVPAHPFLFSGHDRALHHLRRYTRSGFTNLIRGVGFRVVRVSYNNCAAFLPVLVARLARKILGRDRDASDTGPTHPLANRVLSWPYGLELAWLQNFNLPFGVSLIGLFRKR